MKKYLIILLLLPFYISESHPVDDTQLYTSLPFLLLSYHNSNAYGNQIEFGIRPYVTQTHGSLKNVFSSTLNLDYGLRIDYHKKPEHKFRFLFGEQQGINYKTLLRYGTSIQDSLSGEYLFNHFGFKLIEWSNLNNFTEFNIFQISNEFTLENRTHYSQHICYFGYYIPETHNFYFIPRLTFEISYINLEKSIFKLPSTLSEKSFWDIPIGAYCEIGYEWSYEKESFHKTLSDSSLFWYRLINGINFFLDYKKYPFRNFEVITYGAKINIMPCPYCSKFSISFEKNEIDIDNFKNDYYDISLEMTYFLEFLYSILLY